MEIKKLKNILEAVLLASERSLTVIQLEGLFELDEERPTRDEIRQALHEMEADFEPRGFELKHVASGFRLQVKQEFSTWVGRLWEEKPARYTRALLETMALIAYRQPVTRGEIEEVRGVSVSSNIIKTLLERDWIKVLGHKDVPGKPTLYGTTKEFLDYFNLQKLDQLPTLAEIKDLDSIHPELELDDDAVKESDDSDMENPNTDNADPDNTDTDNLAANDSDAESDQSAGDDIQSITETETGEASAAESGDSEHDGSEHDSEHGDSEQASAEAVEAAEEDSESADDETREQSARSAFNV